LTNAISRTNWIFSVVLYTLHPCLEFVRFSFPIIGGFVIDSNCRCAYLFLIAGYIAILTGCGSNVVEINPPSAVLAPGQSFQFTVASIQTYSGEGQALLTVNGVAGGSVSTGTITAGGLYTAPSTPPGQPITIGVQGHNASSSVTILTPGSLTSSVAATQNPLVASYSITAPAASSVQVNFGPDTNYGFSTSPVQAPSNGGTVNVLVAGMRASTTYHMQATATPAQGPPLLDKDHTFTSGSIPANRLPTMTTQLTGVGTPSPGVELFSLVPLTNAANPILNTVATDLEGNVIWYYDLGETGLYPEPVKLLPNGHMLVLVTTAVNEIREIDLTGNIINKVTIPQVDAAIAGMVDFQIATFTHDVAVLPNGHWLLLLDFDATVNNVSGVPNGTGIIADAIIDWNLQTGTADWIWSTLDHLSVARAPFGLPDWTHSNALIYSPDDGNLILSMRNQNWVVKINYDNGAGDGTILWRLGDGGDFTLPAGQAPIEYNYGQHYPTIVSPNSSGVISLMFFNNGNNRLVDANNDICGQGGFIGCYSSVPIVQLNESTKQETVLWEDILLPAYSICCGDALVLPNGNYEYDVAYNILTPNFSHIQEVTESQELVWNMDIEGQLAYRGFRIPSLYPGQIWPATAGTTANRVSSGPAHAAAPAVRGINQLP
jgi:arylsulfate sulfotransferase